MGGGDRRRSARNADAITAAAASCAVTPTGTRRRAARQPLGRNTIAALWGNCTIKVMVGFLFLYPAFVAKSHDASGWEQLRILGVIGAAAAIGNFGGNFTAARLKLGHPSLLVVRCTIAVTTVRAGHRADGQADGGRARDPGHVRGGRDREGVTGRVAAGRPARAVARVGVRTFGVVVAVGLGRWWCHRRADLHRTVGGLHRHHRGADSRTGADAW